jgi:nitric oxide reductase large subunit
MGLVMLISFTVLGSIGYKAINNAPPIPSKVVTADGRVLFTGETIRDGQNVWQSTGGQEVGTIWGHGAYVAPDWSADYLHRLGDRAESLETGPAAQPSYGAPSASYCCSRALAAWSGTSLRKTISPRAAACRAAIRCSG